MSTPLRRVLVLLDDPVIYAAIKLTLNHGAYITRSAPNVPSALAVVEEWQPHLALCDMRLEGIAFLVALGGTGGSVATRIPVLALTRHEDLATKLRAFDHGVDDIMRMPFSSEELLARVIVLTRRRYGEPPPIRPTLTIGELTVDITKRQVRVGSAEIQLTPLELNLLYLLAANAGRPVSRVEILGALWGTDFIAASNVVDRHVGALRLRLQDDPRRPRFIATVPGIGYRFIPAPTVDGAEC